MKIVLHAMSLQRRSVEFNIFSFVDAILFRMIDEFEKCWD